MHARHLEAIGTAWQIDTGRPLAADVEADVRDRVERFDAAWSRFRADSLVTAISRSAGTWRLPQEAGVLLALYDDLHRLTDGAVNPLVGRALSDLGYDADYSLVPSAGPGQVPDWSSVHWCAPALTTSVPVLLDVGAAGKGLLVDLVSAVLRAHRVDQHTIDASGDLLHRGTTPIRVALEHPADPSRAVGVVDLAEGHALCGSASNRRAWGDGLHHVVDARSGRPTRDVVATWVVVDGSRTDHPCMVADGLATAHFFAAPDRLVGRFEHEFVRMHADGRVEWSSDLPGEVFA